MARDAVCAHRAIATKGANLPAKAMTSGLFVKTQGVKMIMTAASGGEQISESRAECKMYIRQRG